MDRADHKTRFSKDRQPEKTGRPQGSRDRISTAFLTALADHFEKNGANAIAKVYAEDTTAYLRVVQATMPKEIEIKRPLEDIPDAQLAQMVAMLAEVIRAQAPPAEEEPKVLQ